MDEAPSTTTGARRGPRLPSGRRAIAVVGLALAALATVASPLQPAAASHEASWDATVNGQPFHGEGSPRLDGCSITVAVAGLAEGAHTVEWSISLTDPSGSDVLASGADTTDGTTWQVTRALDAELADVEPHGNGHHLVVDLSVDGVEERSRPFWLACGAEGGNPFRVVFDVVWTDAEGTDLAGPPAELDRSTYELTAESARGTASCTYGPTDLLTCTYANTHGHEAETDALIVPAGRRHTFSVAQTPLPAGWEPSAGLGTFLVRDVCPRDDHGGHDGGEDPEAATRAHDDDPCLHVVVDVGPPPPPTTTTTTTTTTAPTTTPTTSTSPTGVEAATSPVPTPTTGTRPDTTSTGSGTLPATGVASLPLGAVGGALVVLGTVLRALGRRVP